ncbi:uncharacterized protein LOC117182152 [Belonocnema kinseyi]|uniref:uncharacterized protein LOC117182152 n=1 Tax=Belonocnema kinseyi TaxID=2817044 RepID=UPI00143DF201|nr:uncharacterized protein LOC117182152 [Belonocnema kinseyi]
MGTLLFTVAVFLLDSFESRPSDSEVYTRKIYTYNEEDTFRLTGDPNTYQRIREVLKDNGKIRVEFVKLNNAHQPTRIIKHIVLQDGQIQHESGEPLQGWNALNQYLQSRELLRVQTERLENLQHRTQRSQNSPQSSKN